VENKKEKGDKKKRNKKKEKIKQLLTTYE